MNWKDEHGRLLCIGGPAHGEWAHSHLPGGGMRWAERLKGDALRMHSYTEAVVAGTTALIWVGSVP